MSQFLHDNDNVDAKPIAITWVFSKNSQARNAGYRHFLLLLIVFSKTTFLYTVVKRWNCFVKSYNECTFNKLILQKLKCNDIKHCSKFT